MDHTFRLLCAGVVLMFVVVRFSGPCWVVGGSLDQCAGDVRDGRRRDLLQTLQSVFRDLQPGGPAGQGGQVASGHVASLLRPLAHKIKGKAIDNHAFWCSLGTACSDPPAVHLHGISKLTKIFILEGTLVLTNITVEGQ